ncbi:adenosylmethionine-8-amino-7-oxononanoate aminotransferase [Bordetella pertussis]|nr:adenosylmethionine-8-amino-7-oxononanoate aminotransferase [Bordetella pertussis]
MAAAQASARVFEGFWSDDPGHALMHGPTFMGCALATVAASGSVPPVSALDRVTMSGRTPACSKANIVPVRPKPVKISSKINRMPYRSASSRNRASTCGSCSSMPPAPCTRGSTSMPAIRPAWRSRCACRAASAASSRGSASTSCSGSRPRNMACIPSSGSHTAMVPKVSPW